MAETACTARPTPHGTPQHPSEPRDASHDSHSSPAPHQPKLPLELVKGILEYSWSDGTAEGVAAVFSSCLASRAFASVARAIIWRAVLVECVNVAKSYEEGYSQALNDPYSSSSCWELSPTARCRLSVLLDRPDLRILIRTFKICPPNGVLRSETASMWPTDFGLVQSVISTLPKVTAIGLAWIHDPDKLYLRPPSQSDSLHTLAVADVKIDEEFLAVFPNLRHLSVRKFSEYRLTEPKHRPPIEIFEYSGHGDAFSRLFRSLGSTLLHLSIDRIPNRDHFSLGEVEPHPELLQPLVRLQDFTGTLRDWYTRTNETGSRKRSAPRNGLISDIAQVFTILATLPHPQQVVLHFVLPPLANPEHRRRDKRFWQRFFTSLREGGSLDAMVPKTIKEVDWSGVFGEGE
ncbi:hypothetical protein OF846_004880 [Rhodotorula toruloides]|nr:hypothetical protein OF846_004880 [Rhodotorula toruloides]